MKYDESAAGAAVAITLEAHPQRAHEISGVVWSYDDAPSGGGIDIEDTSGTILSFDITAGGPGFVYFPDNDRPTGKRGQALTVTLRAGGGSVVGKLTVIGNDVV